MRSTNVLTPRGVARVLFRGLRANFAPEHQAAETNRLGDYLQDLGHVPGDGGRIARLPAGGRRAGRARRRLARRGRRPELEELGHCPPNVPGPSVVPPQSHETLSTQS